MDEIKLKRIATKISKCLALTASDNPEEAAGGKYTPPLYLVYLSNIIADAFGC